MDALLKAERDAIATLGLLANNYFEFDPPIKLPGDKVTHCRGFNVHCCVIDNRDGELLALERNRIHAEDDPLQHAEQRAVRAAIARLHVKRPRPDGKTAEEYYQGHLFMEPGQTEADYLRKGCSLYNTFDPCAMCAVTLLIAYMKRIAYVFEDEKFSKVYGQMKTDFFSSRHSVKERVALGAASSPFIDATRKLLTRLDSNVAALLAHNVPLVQVLDSCRDDLAAAADLLREASPAALITTGADKASCVKTLADFQRACRLPVRL
jgi:tRNA(Arg) A34 adenosine deaminase TadA